MSVGDVGVVVTWKVSGLDRQLFATGGGGST
jgi:hypothetical protein